MPKNAPYLTRFFEKVEFPSNIDECWLWKGGKTKGYGVFWLNGRSYYAQVAAKILIQDEYPAPGQLGCHTCDNPACVNPFHVFYGSVRDNSLDAKRKGRLNYVYLKKMTPDKVKQIIAAVGTQHKIASQFGISQSVVSEIRSGKSLRYISGV